jgi:hypothetical protein
MNCPLLMRLVRRQHLDAFPPLAFLAIVDTAGMVAADSLTPAVSIGTPGTIIYAPVLSARVAHNRLYLEVHRDAYKRAGDPLTAVQRFALSEGIGPLLDWQRVEEVVRLKEGVAREVNRQAHRGLD